MPRLTALALALAATVALAACGDDEPETAARPTPQRPMVDTTLGDTVPAPGQEPGARPADPSASGAVGETGAGEVGAAAPGRAGQAAPGAQTAQPAAPAGQAGQAGRPRPAGAAPTTSSGSRLYTVQVGAFVEPETAREWEGRLAAQGLPVWVSIAELGGQTFYRLRVGAVSSVTDARRLGRLITARYEWPVWVAPLTPSDRLPAGAVERSRQVLDAG